jgi:5-methylcytosine-specific restriction endonuclease McrA
MTERTWEPMDPRTKLTRKQIAELFLRQDGLCPLCGQKLQTKGHKPVEFIDEHMIARWAGGSEDLGNRALVCKPCAKGKTAAEATELAKMKAVRDRHIGAKKSKQPFKGWRNFRGEPVYANQED